MPPEIRFSEYASLTDDDLVTGEAVALDLPPAGLGPRILSGLIDVIATVALVFAAAMILLVSASSTDQALVWAAYIAVTVVAFVVFPTTLETLTRGRSLGKLALGLRTVRDDAGPISFQQALTRALIGYVEIYAASGAPAFFSALLSTRGKRLGDYAAGTYVVRERVRLQLPPPIPMPPRLAGWAATADIATIPTGLSLAIRQFLIRAHDFAPAARAEVGGRLADQALPYVAPRPPAGTYPEEFLAAVIAARRDRDLARLDREARLRDRLTRR